MRLTPLARVRSTLPQPPPRSTLRPQPFSALQRRRPLTLPLLVLPLSRILLRPRLFLGVLSASLRMVLALSLVHPPGPVCCRVRAVSPHARLDILPAQIGRASCRERV